MKSKIIALIILIFLTFNLLLATSSVKNTKPLEPLDFYETKITTYILHDPIVITSDVDFESQGWPGDGTWSNPYVIEGLKITTLEKGIEIMDTTVDFEIRNCIITSNGLANDDGISLTNVVDGRVKNCFIEFHRMGITVTDSQHCTLTNNTSMNNMYDGFSLSESSYCTLTNNTAINNPNWGVKLRISEDCNLDNNLIVNNIYGGVLLSWSISCSLTNNDLYGNGILIGSTEIVSWLHIMSNNTVNGKPLGYFTSLVDTILDGSQYGQIILANCSNVGIESGIFTNTSRIQIGFSRNCTVANTSSDGIQLQSSEYCTLTDNFVSRSTIDGFFLQDSSHCTLTNNIAVNNSIDGFHIGAYNSTLRNNIAIDNWYSGFYIGSDNCLLENNTGNHNRISGFYVDLDNCTLICNSAVGNSDGFYFGYSDNSTLTNNTAVDNRNGFRLRHSVNCTLIDNIAFDNWGKGIYLHSDSRDNILYLNRLAYNGYIGDSNALDNGTSNRWDDGISYGNYWSNYDGNGTHTIPGSAGSIDHFPVAMIYVSIDILVPIINSPPDIEFVEGDTGHTIVWTPSDLYPFGYIISRDGIIVKNESWITSSESIMIYVDNLSVGTYVFQINVTDIGGNYATDQVIVTVLQATNTITTSTSITETPLPNPNMIPYVFGGFVIVIVIVLIACFKMGKKPDTF